jgi:hypothetical protein
MAMKGEIAVRRPSIPLGGVVTSFCPSFCQHFHLKNNTKIVTAVVTPLIAGRMKYGSAAVRSLNQSVPPVSQPGTGAFEHRQQVLNMAKKKGICMIPKKLTNGEYPHSLYIDCKVSFAFLIAIKLFDCLAAFTWAMISFEWSAIRGVMAVLRAIFSMSGNSTTRSIAVRRMILPHQGSPVETWQNSKSLIIRSEGHQVVPRSSAARSPTWYIPSVGPNSFRSSMPEDSSRMRWASVEMQAASFVRGRTRVGREAENIGCTFWISLLEGDILYLV